MENSFHSNDGQTYQRVPSEHLKNCEGNSNFLPNLRATDPQTRANSH